MTKYVSAFAAAALSLAIASPALAGWDRSQVTDPAFSRSYDRQLELADDRVAPRPVDAVSTSAIATNDAPETIYQTKPWFGPNLDRATGRVNSPHAD